MKKHCSAPFAALGCGRAVRMLCASGGILLLIAFDFLFSKASYAQSGGIITAVNISARAAVGAGKNDVLDGGFIVVNGPKKSVLIRALGPSLVAEGLVGTLQDPELELHDSNGRMLGFNDDWTSDQQAEIFFTNLAPSNPHESAILTSLTPGSYSATVFGKNGSTGTALVEVYVLP